MPELTSRRQSRENLKTLHLSQFRRESLFTYLRAPCGDMPYLPIHSLQDVRQPFSTGFPILTQIMSQLAFLKAPEKKNLSECAQWTPERQGRQALLRFSCLMLPTALSTGPGTQRTLSVG